MSQGFPFLLGLVSRLKEAGFEHYLEHQDECILVLANTPTQRWEIKIFESGELAITIFDRDPKTYGADKLNELFSNTPQWPPR